jgi:hypothetical protein
VIVPVGKGVGLNGHAVADNALDGKSAFVGARPDIFDDDALPA